MATQKFVLLSDWRYQRLIIEKFKLLVQLTVLEAFYKNFKKPIYDLLSLNLRFRLKPKSKQFPYRVNK